MLCIRSFPDRECAVFRHGPLATAGILLPVNAVLVWGVCGQYRGGEVVCVSQMRVFGGGGAADA